MTEFGRESIGRAAVFRRAILTAETELSQGIAAATAIGEHDLAAAGQAVLRKLHVAHRAAEALAAMAAPIAGGPILPDSGGDDKPPQR